MKEFKRYYIVRKKFVDWFRIHILKYERVIIQSPIILNKSGEEKFIEWLESEFNKSYIRYKKCEASYIGTMNVKIRYFTYFIYKYDLKDFDKKVIKMGYDIKYPVNNPNIRDVLNINKIKFFVDVLKPENYRVIELSDLFD